MPNKKGRAKYFGGIGLQHQQSTTKIIKCPKICLFSLFPLYSAGGMTFRGTKIPVFWGDLAGPRLTFRGTKIPGNGPPKSQI